MFQTDSFHFGYYLAFGAWMALAAFWLLLTWRFLLVKLYFLSACAFFLFALKRRGGVEFLFLEWFYGRRFFMERA